MKVEGMKITGRPTRRGLAIQVAAISIGVATLMSSPVATAAPGQPGLVDMDEQCRLQYPGTDGFGIGQSYLVAPSDAYSWRCKRVGLNAELPVNPQAYCSPHRAEPAPDGTNWECK